MAKPLLFLHGALGCAQQLQDTLLPQQGWQGFEPHVVEFSGHGKTPPRSEFGIAAFANEVIAYLDRKSIEKIAVWGYSMGGYVGLYLARHYPERVEAVFTLATKLAWSPEGAAKEASRLNPEIIAEKVPAFAAQLKDLHGEAWAALCKSTAQMMLAMGEHPPLAPADYAAIACPVRLGLGDRDKMVSWAETQQVFEQLPDASICVFPSTPHPLERVSLTHIVWQAEQFFFSL